MSLENVEWVKPSELKTNPRNTNTHSGEQITRLAKLIDHYGWRYPIVARESDKMIASGEGRLLAARELGLALVPVSFQKFESEQQFQAFTTADNAIHEWSEIDLARVMDDVEEFGEDFDLELLGFKDLDLGDLDKLEPMAEDDKVPEPKESVCKPGDLWVLGRHRLLCGDATNIQHVEMLMGSEKADMVFTDPPYGMSAVTKSGVLSKNYQSDIMNDDSTEVAKESFNCVQSLGIEKQVFWGANYYSSSLPDASCWLVWNKNNGQSDQMDAELAWTNLKGVTRMFTQASEKKDRVHPTQKPVSLAEWCFDKWEAEKVLDVFGGSGSTLIACEKTDRQCFMMELDPYYCDVIITRWEKFTGLKAKLTTEGSPSYE